MFFDLQKGWRVNPRLKVVLWYTWLTAVCIYLLLYYVKEDSPKVCIPCSCFSQRSVPLFTSIPVLAGDGQFNHWEVMFPVRVQCLCSRYKSSTDDTHSLSASSPLWSCARRLLSGRIRGRFSDTFQLLHLVSQAPAISRRFAVITFQTDLRVMLDFLLHLISNGTVIL